MPSNQTVSVLARGCLVLFLTLFAAFSFADSICEKGLVPNVNASLSMEDYRQTNHRPYVAFAHKFGVTFSRLFNDVTRIVRWLESGGGYGLAPLEMARVNPMVNATVINSQDAWTYILNLKKDEARCVKKTLARMGNLLGARMDDIADSGQLCFAEGWFDRLVPRLKEKFGEQLDTGRLQYVIGMAEEVLSEMAELFEVITDMFGAYFYSAARIQLLDLYYERLAPDGEAFVVFHTQDIKHQVSPPLIDSYGPHNSIEGSKKSFEETLCELYPQIFRILEVENPDGITRSLHIKKVKGVSLKLSERFETIESWYDLDAKLPISRQIPNILLRRRF